MTKEINYGDDYFYIPVTSLKSGNGVELLPDLYCYTVQIVNITLIGHPDNDEFVLIDTGMPESVNKVIAAIDERFGKNSRPLAIILTHGHFDHVGAVVDLVSYYQVPVYAHELELPFLTGEEAYPNPDATVEGGLVAKMSPIFPTKPIDLGNHIKPLPKDGTVPFLKDFKWIHTPGHAPGHISLFRENDSVLIAGDAFSTVKQDSFSKVFMQEKEINGPPRYLTTDWDAAKQSIVKLAKLQPAITITGHGVPMQGEELSKSLSYLINNFEEIAVPDYGKYLN